MAIFNSYVKFSEGIILTLTNNSYQVIRAAWWSHILRQAAACFWTKAAWVASVQIVTLARDEPGFTQDPTHLMDTMHYLFKPVAFYPYCSFSQHPKPAFARGVRHLRHPIDPAFSSSKSSYSSKPHPSSSLSTASSSGLSQNKKQWHRKLRHRYTTHSCCWNMLKLPILEPSGQPSQLLGQPPRQCHEGLHVAPCATRHHKDLTAGSAASQWVSG